ncbi:MAG TPA: polysaccharide deacetylase [Desulfobacterales bacterium]|nr:polysaccharide deacetylase [Desulfobacterales bacterium]
MKTMRKFPVMLTFDIDAETLWTARDPKMENYPVALSQGVYGTKIGVDRILKLLSRYGIAATFFVPGKTIERNQNLIKKVIDQGHEISHHSYSHKWLETLSIDEEREELGKGLDLIENIYGRKPRGYRSPAGEFTPHTFDLLLEYGFEYSSNFFDDEEPYKHIINGEKSELIELPFAWALDDAPFFLYSNRLPGRFMAAPSAVLETWKIEFNGLYAEDKCMVLAMHPQIIGRPSRMYILESLIQHIMGKPNVWFARCDQVIDAVKDHL